MINYEIIRLDNHRKEMNVKFSHDDESKPNFYTLMSLPDTYTESQVHSIIETNAEQAQWFWNEYENAPDFTLSETTGTIKNIQLEDMPEYNSLYQRVEEVWTEDEDTKYKSYNLVDYTAEEKARNIRERRDRQLQVTDNEAVSDRTISQEMLDYRQALRDITDQETFPNSVIWPIRPIG